MHSETGLRVHVFGLEVEGYQLAAGEIHIFGEAHGEWLAIEDRGLDNGRSDYYFPRAVLW